jgi:hypothetical protein
VGASGVPDPCAELGVALGVGAVVGALACGVASGWSCEGVATRSESAADWRTGSSNDWHPAVKARLETATSAHSKRREEDLVK